MYLSLPTTNQNQTRIKQNRKPPSLQILSQLPRPLLPMPSSRAPFSNSQLAPSLCPPRLAQVLIPAMATGETTQHWGRGEPAGRALLRSARTRNFRDDTAQRGTLASWSQDQENVASGWEEERLSKDQEAAGKIRWRRGSVEVGGCQLSCHPDRVWPLSTPKGT